MTTWYRHVQDGWAPKTALVALVALMTVGMTSCVPPKNYVALGDSYAAGDGIPVQQTDPAGCHRSNHDYPRVVETDLGLPVFRDVTCSGAVTNDLTSSQSVSPGPNPPPQFHALDTNTAAVSLTIGGNDIGFSEILANCFSGTNTGTPCKDRYVVNGHDEISDRIAAVAPKVKAALQGIHQRAPGAKIFLVGYLDISPDDGTNCFPQMPITTGDAPYLRDKAKELNAMLHTTATANGAVYVDSYTPSIGHDACKTPDVRWVEPLAAVGAAPVHPNARGMRGVARHLLAAMRSNGL